MTFDIRPVADDLTKVLHHSHRLQYLYLSSCDNFLRASSASYAALLRLSALRELEVHGVGQLTIPLLKEMRMPLTSLELDLDSFGIILNPPLPYELLRNFSVSLNRVSLGSIAMRTGSIAFHCPNVHTLQLSANCDISLNEFFVEPLLLAFPNITHLVSVVKLGLDDDYFDAVSREANRQAVRKQQPSWSNLDFLGGTPPTLRHLGLMSPVRYLNIDKIHPLGTTVLSHLLDDLQPNCLDIDIVDNEWDGWPNLKEMLARIFQNTSLSHLVIGLVSDWYQGLVLSQQVLVSDHCDSDSFSG